MSEVTTNQPDGTPTWVDLGIPDVERAAAFYRAVLGWEIEVGPAEMGYYSMCLLRGKPVAALSQPPGVEESDRHWWNVYLATADCDATIKRVTDAGGTIVMPPMDIMSAGRMALATDPSGAQFGLWQGRDHIGCGLVNEPGALIRNDLVTPTPEPAAAFYREVFGFTPDANPEIPGSDFTFLRRPDGHDVAGVMGEPGAPRSQWNTTFEVADTDAVTHAVTAAGGTVDHVENIVYGHIAALRDPFGAEFSVITRA